MLYDRGARIASLISLNCYVDLGLGYPARRVNAVLLENVSDRSAGELELTGNSSQGADNAIALDKGPCFVCP
jgi:hypothetical protein